MNITGMKEIMALNEEKPQVEKRQKLVHLIETGKLDPKEDPSVDEIRIHLNEEAIRQAYVS